MCFGGRSSIKLMMETAPFEAFPILVRCDRTSARQHLLLVIWLLWGVWLLLSLHPELVVKAEGERDWEGTGEQRVHSAALSGTWVDAHICTWLRLRNGTERYYSTRLNYKAVRIIAKLL